MTTKNNLKKLYRVETDEEAEYVEANTPEEAVHLAINGKTLSGDSLFVDDGGEVCILETVVKFRVDPMPRKLTKVK